MLIGVVGKANVGKSTFFKALTLAEVAINNYPFVTIRPNSGVGYVKVPCAEKEFEVRCQPKHGFCLNNSRFVPVQLLDVAGLVPGAHEGKGMGNQFLDDLRQADVLIHVVDCAGSTNEKGEPIQPGSYNPADDIKFLEVEIDMWYYQILRKGWEKFAREIQQTKQEVHKAIAKQLSAMKVTEEMVASTLEELGFDAANITRWSDEQLKALASRFRKLTKPMIIACNKIDIPVAERNFQRMKQEFPEYILIPCSSESELALREAAKHGLISYVSGGSSFEIAAADNLNEKQKKALEFIRTGVLARFGSTGVQEVIDKAVFDLLRYIYVYPVANSHLQDKDGNVLPDCLIVPENITALEFAYKVHTEIGDHFIRAIDLRTKHVVGKDHTLKSGDVIEIVVAK
jgi:ribosome-binding ATPase YchF (GTP1/OBG family)